MKEFKIGDIVIDQMNDHLTGRIKDIFFSAQSETRVYQLNDLEDNCYWFAFQVQLKQQ